MQSDHRSEYSEIWKKKDKLRLNSFSSSSFELFVLSIMQEDVHTLRERSCSTTNKLAE